MNAWLLTAALSYGALAAGHSWLGERLILGPLLRQPWQLGLPRRFADPLLRWAWHLTSVAWLAPAIVLGAAAGGAAVSPLVLCGLGGLALVSGAIIGIALRGTHQAWVVFALAALGCFVGAHGWPEATAVRAAAGAGAGMTFAVLAGLHVYWFAGGRWGARAAVPTAADGTALLQPSRLATLAVATALLGAAIVVASAGGALPALPLAGAVRVLALAAAAAFGLRMIGDFRLVGLFKRERRTEFARWDSMLFSPLCGALSLACAIAAV